MPLTVYTHAMLRARALSFADACAREQGGLDLDAGPLFRAALLATHDAEPDRLLLVAHHLVVDAVSWRILVSDLAALLSGVEPPRSPSFAAWAQQTTGQAHEPWLVGRAAPWLSAAPAVAPTPLADAGTEAEAACFAWTASRDQRDDRPCPQHFGYVVLAFFDDLAPSLPRSGSTRRMRIQPVDATHLRLHSSEECCNETEAADLVEGSR
ncbi:condensation domain-containing protein [Burkholderia sp. BKH01]|uniref:condensation domain-containing protein n=1 Tax=Burkholderia sp. BKH01 TaxID=2769262 RepID=UPI0021DF8A09|nr:condensation domain-containing protein [Burkholderia sp. BKH01]MCU9951917.1 condensation domain-containing protein [Burkholderia sp. BKH01]